MKILCIRQYKDLGFDNIVIETDSELVVGWLKMNSCSAWYLWDYWERLEEALQGMNFTIIHQYREGNQAVDFLARQGENGITQCYLTSEHIPIKLRGFIRLDKLGLPNNWCRTHNSAPGLTGFQ